MAILEIPNIQQTNISARVTGMSGGMHRRAVFEIRTPSGSYRTFAESGLLGNDVTSTSTYWATGLSPGTTYIIRARIYNYYNANDIPFEATKQVTTLSPPDNTAPSVGNIYTTVDPGKILTSEGLTNADTFIIGCTITDPSGVASASVTINGVNYSNPYISGNSYTWRVQTPTTYKSHTFTIGARDGLGNVGNTSSSVTICRDTEKPILGNCSVSYANGQIQAEGEASDNLGLKSVIYKISKANQKVYGDTIETSSGSSYYFTKDADGYDFVKGARYYVEFTARDKVDNYSEKKEVEIIPTWTKPSNWTWTQAESNAINGRGSIKTITASRWDAFCEHIRLVSLWFLNQNSGDPYNLNGAKINNGDKTLTATKFNIVRNAIGSMNKLGSGLDPNDIVTKKPVMGWYFSTLTTRLNTISNTSSLGTMGQLYNMDILLIAAKIQETLLYYS